MNLGELILEIPSVTTLYITAVMVFFVILLVILLINLRKATNRREERFKSRKPEAGFSNPTKTIKRSSLKRKKAGLESIENQFTITKKILIPFVAVMAIAMASIPFLDRIPAAVLSLFIGGFSLILGIAVRPLLENVFAGLVISYSKSMNIGDTVMIDEHYGTVEDITMSYTTVKTWDWKRYVIPNSRMLQKEFKNLSLVEKYQWSYVEFFVSYDSDIELVKKIALECAANSEYTVEDNVPDFWVMEMKENSYKCWIASWTENPGQAWTFKSNLRTDLISAFEKNRIKSYALNHYKSEKASR